MERNDFKAKAEYMNKLRELDDEISWLLRKLAEAYEVAAKMTERMDELFPIRGTEAGEQTEEIWERRQGDGGAKL